MKNEPKRQQGMAMGMIIKYDVKSGRVRRNSNIASRWGRYATMMIKVED